MILTKSGATTHGANLLQLIFVGRCGVRAGWRILIFFALLLTLFRITVPLQRIVGQWLGHDFNATNVALSRAFTFALLFLATAIVGKFEHRRLADYGLPARGMLGKNFWIGALWGFVMLSCIIGMMIAAHAYSTGSAALAPLAIVKFGFLWALAFLMVGLFEEFTFRGYLQFTLTWGLGFWPAAAVTCVIFALAHRGNPGETWVGLVEIVLIALFLCLALRRTGNLWFAIGWHMAFDWGESFFYSTPNSGIHATGHLLNASLMGSKWLSGGSVGPEASVFDLLVTIAGILLLAKLYPDAKYPASLPALSAPAEQLPSSSSEPGPPGDVKYIS
jgi:membrane protease YdiL (CAAX protease family)